jgi:hypothetical protein
MTPDEAIETAQQAILTKTGVLLKDLPLMILRDSLADKTYVEMQDKGYELPTIKEAGLIHPPEKNRSNPFLSLSLDRM